MEWRLGSKPYIKGAFAENGEGGGAFIMRVWYLEPPVMVLRAVFFFPFFCGTSIGVKFSSPFLLKQKVNGRKQLYLCYISLPVISTEVCKVESDFPNHCHDKRLTSDFFLLHLRIKKVV